MRIYTIVISDDTHWFLLQALDDETGCAVLEMRFRVGDLSLIREILRGEDEGDERLVRSYQLDNGQLLSITGLFGVQFDPGERPAWLNPWHGIREVPYLVHTGFELPLLLDGYKPFAAFGDFYPSDWFEDFLAPFDRHVADGRLIRRTVDQPFDKARGRGYAGVRDVYFAVRGQEWRIDAYILLKDVAAKAGWNDALERFQGSLLGYSDEQNDWWIAHRHSIARKRVAAK